jgi:hypothetical protein
MKNINITLHPFSVLTGMALLGFGLIATGAFAPQGSSGQRDVSAMENVNEPRPADYVRIDDHTPYTVPADKFFVLTALGCDTYASGLRVQVLVDGVIWFEGQGYLGSASADSIHLVPPGVVVAGGSTIELYDGNPNYTGIGLGYLTDA